MAATVLLFVIVNWFVPWPFSARPADVPANELDARHRSDRQTLDAERRACEIIDREISATRRVLGSGAAEETT